MRRYAVIGQSLKHSFSPQYFTEKFRRMRIHDATYTAIELPDEAALHQFIAACDLSGFNVTTPYKESVIPLLDYCDPIARSTGSVNCVKQANRKLYGFNTDVIGFERTLKPLLKKKKVKALVLGTGGASKAVQYVLKSLNIPFLTVSASGRGDLDYDQVTASLLKQYRLLVQCTPVGTWPDIKAKLNLPYQSMGSDFILYDLIYNPGVSAFLREGLIRGAVVRNGMEMLRIQADESWKIWANDRPVL
jgi:shikimate dehydrogenase